MNGVILSQEIGKTMKKNLILGSCLLLSVLTFNAQATISTWDPQAGITNNPYLGNLSGTWESANWDTANQTGTATPVAFVESSLAIFAVHTGTNTPAFTMTMNANHTVSGIYDGALGAAACTVTIAGTGVMTIGGPGGALFANIQGFDIVNFPTDPGTVIINVPITGTLASASALCFDNSGSLYLNGSNSYGSGTLLGYSGQSLSGVLYVTNADSTHPGICTSFGTAAIGISNCLGAAIVAQGTSAYSITNAVTVYNKAGGGQSINLVAPAAGSPLTFSGPWSVGTNFLQIGAGGSGYTTIISGIIGGTSGGITRGQANLGTLMLTATNTYTGATTVTNGTLQLGDGVSRSGTVAGGLVVTNNGILILAPAPGQPITYNGGSQVISGPGAVTMNGPGTFIIGGNHNTYSGGTVINGGILQTGGDQTTTGTAANLGLTPATFQPANIKLGGGVLQGNNPNFAFMANRGITLTANSGLSAITNGNEAAPLQGEMGIQGVITDNGAGYGITISGQTNLTTGLLSGVYLEGVNTYTGPTVVQSGILSLYYNGSINSSSSLTINSGATFDVSSNNATTWNLNQPLVANGMGLGWPGYYTPAPTAAAIIIGANGGNLSFGSEPLYLSINPTNLTGDAEQPALFVSQGTLQLVGNTVYVTNNAASPLGYGSYTLVQQASGSISSPLALTLGNGTVYGSGIVAGATASLVVSGGAVTLVVLPPGGSVAPYFSGLSPSPLGVFTYGSGTSLNLSGTVSNMAGGVATAGDTITVQIGNFGAQPATIGANGSYSLSYPIPAYAPAGYYDISSSYSGLLGSASDNSAGLQITPALLAVTASNPSRNYNGTATATVTLTPVPLNGDSVTIGQSAAPEGSTNFATSSPGTNIQVTITGLELSGPNAGNYFLPSTYTLTANIYSPGETWNGNDFANSPNWSDANNWASTNAPDPFGDSLDFGGTNGLTPVMQGPYTNWSLTFDSTAGLFVITNTGAGVVAMSLGAGGITDDSLNAQTISVPVSNLTTLSAQWFVTNGGSLLMTSNVSDAGGGLTLSGTGNLTLSGSNNAITGPITNLGLAMTISGAAKLNNGSYSGAISNNGSLTYNSTSNQTINGVISGTGSLTHSGTGTLTLGNANTFSGTTSIGNGSLVIGADASLGAAPGSFVPNQLYMNCNISNGANNYGLRDTGGTFTLNANRGINLGPLGGSINVQNGQTLTVAGVISGSGPFYASPNSSAGYGTIILTAANTYSGPTIVGAGTLTMGASGVLPSGTPLTIGSSAQGAANGSFFNMQGNTQTIGNLASSAGIGAAGTGTPTIQNLGALTVLETNVNTTFGGVISGAGGTLTLSVPNGGAASELFLGGTNTYTGATTINAGATLGLSGKGAISNSASLVIGQGGTFDVSSLTATTFNLSASTTFTASGSGTAVGSTAATIKGSAVVNLGSQAIQLAYSPASVAGDAAHPALYVSQGALTFNGNALTINTASQLGAGVYTLIQTSSGTINGAPASSATFTGAGIVPYATSAIVSVSGGNVILTIVAPLNSPQITGISISGTALTITATNGNANGNYVLLESTNLSLPLSNWTVIGTNTFDGSGNINLTTNIINPSVPQAFFMIKNP